MFVILGIFILVVSFAVALISLVREERRREGLVSEKVTKEPRVPVLPKQLPAIGKSSGQPSVELDEKEPFPWEAKGESLSGEIKIGEIAKRDE